MEKPEQVSGFVVCGILVFGRKESSFYSLISIQFNAVCYKFGVSSKIYCNRYCRNEILIVSAIFTFGHEPSVTSGSLIGYRKCFIVTVNNDNVAVITPKDGWLGSWFPITNKLVSVWWYNFVPGLDVGIIDSNSGRCEKEWQGNPCYDSKYQKTNEACKLWML